jgi:ABC-type multidrug transport system fused ATPase/permease subunit
MTVALGLNVLTLQATGVRLGMILQAFATIATGIVIAFIYSWKFALFVFGVMPFMLVGAVMQIRLAKGFSMKNKAELEEAGKVMSSAKRGHKNHGIFGFCAQKTSRFQNQCSMCVPTCVNA